MRTHFIRFAAALLPVVLAGCSEPMHDEAAAPSLDFTNGPTSPGPYIIRSEGWFGYGHADYRRGVSATYGFDPVELCQGTYDPELVPIQEIGVPQDVDRFIALQRGPVSAQVWPFTDFDCTLFLNNAPLATGLVQLVYTDNDFLAWLRDPTNQNAWGWTAGGTLTRPDGSQAELQAVIRLVYDSQHVSVIHLR